MLGLLKPCSGVVSVDCDDQVDINEENVTDNADDNIDADEDEDHVDNNEKHDLYVHNY